MVKNIKMTIQYDGSSFYGWQKQNNKRTVEGELSKAINKVLGRKTRLVVAGRTDSGVHANGQVVNFLTTSKIHPASLYHHINAKIPEDIKVVKSEEVDLSFNARFDAKKKRYIYRLMNKKDLHPIERKYFGFSSYELNLKNMIEASKYLVGRQDFKSFVKYSEGLNTIREIDRFKIEKFGYEIDFQVEAMSFMRNQIRIMVGTLLDVGRGKFKPEDMKKILQLKDRSSSGATAEANGLYLDQIIY